MKEREYEVLMDDGRTEVFNETSATEALWRARAQGFSPVSAELIEDDYSAEFALDVLEVA